MKKCGFIVAMLSVATLGFSQAKKVRFGIQAGANIANLNSKFTYTSNNISFTSKLPFSNIVGFIGGIHAELPLGKNLYLQPELSYSQLGAKVFSGADSIGYGRVEQKGILHYLVLPVLLKYKIAKTGAGVFAGPQVGYLLGTTNKINNTTINEEDNSNFKRDFAAIFGAEYYLPFGLGVSARYQLGISNIQRPESVDLSSLPYGVTPQSISVRNRAFSFTIGYRFQ